MSTSNLDGSDWHIEIPDTLDEIPRWDGTAARERLYVEGIECSPDGSLILVNTLGMRHYTELYDLSDATPPRQVAEVGQKVTATYTVRNAGCTDLVTDLIGVGGLFRLWWCTVAGAGGRLEKSAARSAAPITL